MTILRQTIRATVPGKSSVIKSVSRILIVLTATVMSYWLSFSMQTKSLDLEAQYRLNTAAVELFGPTEKYSYFPKVVAQHPAVMEALLARGDIGRAMKASRLLARLNQDAGTQYIYVLDRSGRTVASSNWDQGDSFIGHDFAFRPYFKDAMEGFEGRFFGMGTVSMVPGFYLSFPVRSQGSIVGVAVVKINLTTVDSEWRSDQGFDLAVTDDAGVVFLSSRAEWKYRPTQELTREQQKKLDQTKKYGGMLRQPMVIGDHKLWSGATQISHVQMSDKATDAREYYVVKTRSLEKSPWTIWVFMSTKKAQEVALINAGVFLGLISVFIAFTMYLQEQKRRLTERLEAQISMRESHERFKILSKATSDVVWDWDIQSDHLWWNENLLKAFGYGSSDLEATYESWSRHVHFEDRARVLEGIQGVIKGGGDMWSDEYRFVCSDGCIAEVFDRGTVIRGPAGEPVRMVGSMIDITERKESEREIQHMALYDSLTDLPNRTLLQVRLQQALNTSARSKSMGALFFIDLDNFKEINDTLGHDKGDLLLKEVAARLSACVRASDCLARLGGDEFVIMAERLAADVDEATMQSKMIAEKVLAALSKPFDLAGATRHTSPSIGISLFDGGVTSVEEILKTADMAMYEAKADGKNTFRFFYPAMQKLAMERSELETDLRVAVGADALYLHYQPQCDKTGAVHGAEALVRWNHPRRGNVSPAEFIPIAEKNGLIIQIGEWVLKEACRQVARWSSDPVLSNVTIAVNVSAKQFHRDDFVERVITTIKESGCDPTRLKLELTESALAADIDDVIRKMEEIRKLGVLFSLDDFGTGYSSLSYLHRLPISQLKIDRSFVMQIAENRNGTAIVRTIVALGQTLGLNVIAEGVETSAQVEGLEAEGCRAYQGYLFGRPVSAEVFATVAKRQA